MIRIFWTLVVVGIYFATLCLLKYAGEDTFVLAGGIAVANVAGYLEGMIRSRSDELGS